MYRQVEAYDCNAERKRVGGGGEGSRDYYEVKYEGGDVCSAKCAKWDS